VDEYDGRQYVGLDLHRRRSVIVRMTPEGERWVLRFVSTMTTLPIRPPRHACPGLVSNQRLRRVRTALFR
jgi:hypothetical protein